MTLVYLTIAWMGGIWLARLAWSAGVLGCRQPGLLVWVGLLALPAAGLAVTYRRPSWRLPAALLFFLLLGGLRYQFHPFAPCFAESDLAFYNGTTEQPVQAMVTGIIVRPPEERDTRVRIRLRAENLLLGEAQSSQPVEGEALFTVDRYPELRYGDRVLVQGRLESPPAFADFDYKAYLARQGVHTMIQRPEVTILSRGHGSPVFRLIYDLRLRGQAAIARLLPEPEAALLTGIVLGMERGIDPDLYDQFNKTGVSHIIVISGSNIAVIAGVLTALFARLLGKRRSFFFVLGGILFYTLLVGGDASVSRAAIMGMLYAWAVYLGRQSTAFVSLFTAGLFMTLINPLTLWDVGFQLSFMATLSLILFTPGLTERFERLLDRGLGWRGRQGTSRQGNKAGDAALSTSPLSTSLRTPLLAFLNDAVMVTLAAQVLTLPLVAHYFGRVSVVSPLANLLVLPVQPPIMIWGGLAVIGGLLAGGGSLLWPLARLLALVPWLALYWTVLVVEWLAPLPFASLNADLSAAGLAGIYGLLAVGMLSSRPALPVLGSSLQRVRQALTSSAAITATAIALLAVFSLLLVAFRSLPDGNLHVHFLDLERGEAVLIETPDGRQVLVDGGYGPTELLSELGQHMPFYDRQIELVVLTHPGDERIGGLAGLAERYQIGQVLQAPFPYPSANFESWLRTLQAENVPIVPAEAGTRIHLGHGAALDVLHPGPEPAFEESGELDLTANSLVLRLSYGETSFLLTGDAPKELQEQLVASDLQLEATIVKLPDGGRQASFSQAFLDAAQPQQAVVFVQREDRFRDLSAAVEQAWIAVVGPEGFHRTDLDGTVSFASSGTELAVTPERR